MWQAKFLILALLLGGLALALPWLAYRRLKSLTRKHGRVLLVRYFFLANRCQQDP